MYIIETYKCFDDDIISSFDYDTNFETKEEAQAYCNAENAKPDNPYHLEPLHITNNDWQEHVKNERELYDKCC